MSTKKPKTSLLAGTIALLVLMSSTILCSIPVLILGILKVIPIKNWRIYCTKRIDDVASYWIDGNNLFLKTFHPTRIDITGSYDYDINDWHLVVANHQSWLDIVILQRVLNRKIPVLKFFIKDQLKWIPLLGFAWWAMGCPFMKRYSKTYLEKHPHKKGKDLQSTKKALQLLKQSPTTIMSFVEGTRYTPEKTKLQKSPYQHLLRPKAGGISFVIDTMKTQLTDILDVTIVYPDKHHSLWDFLCHRISVIKVNIRQIPIPQQFLTTSLLDNNDIALEFRDWLNEKWAEKDVLISRLT